MVQTAHPTLPNPMGSHRVFSIVYPARSGPFGSTKPDAVSQMGRQRGGFKKHERSLDSPTQSTIIRCLWVAGFAKKGNRATINLSGTMMMDQDQKIQQFKQMAEADPENELGHFSLAKALFEAGRLEDAVQPFSRAIELRPTMSKAYQLLGETLDAMGKRKEAIEAVTKGAKIADEQGDVMPRDTMAGLLKRWDAPVPAFKATTAPDAPVAGPSAPGFSCSRCGRPDNQLAKPPFKGELGKKIAENVCTGCWKEWVPMGTKVINELGLALSSESGQQTYDQYMLEFLQLDGR